MDIVLLIYSVALNDLLDLVVIPMAEIPRALHRHSH